MTDKQPQTLSKQTVYIPCFGKDSDAQLILPLTNNKSALNGMPHPVKKIESVYVLTEQEMNNVKREAAEKALEVADTMNHNSTPVSDVFIEHYLNSNYPLTKNTEG